MSYASKSLLHIHGRNSYVLPAEWRDILAAFTGWTWRSDGYAEVSVTCTRARLS